MFYRFIGLVWDVLIFQARALAVQAVVVTLAVSAAPEVQTVRDVRACYVEESGNYTEILTSHI